jgi:type IV pilus assembly protein PilA
MSISVCVIFFNPPYFMSRLSIFYKNQKGFTLIELLIVIAIIAILAAVVFVALDPLTRFQDSRDAVRANDASEMMTAVKIDQIDNGGSYLAAISALTAGQVYMIGTCTTTCNAQNASCDTDPDSSAHGVDLAGLVTEGYLAEIPIGPNGAGTWGASLTGYTIERESTGILHIRSCESENTTEIVISR